MTTEGQNKYGKFVDEHPEYPSMIHTDDGLLMLSDILEKFDKQESKDKPFVEMDLKEVYGWVKENDPIVMQNVEATNLMYDWKTKFLLKFQEKIKQLQKPTP
jgi:hypothetical protein